MPALAFEPLPKPVDIEVIDAAATAAAADRAREAHVYDVRVERDIAYNPQAPTCKYRMYDLYIPTNRVSTGAAAAAAEASVHTPTGSEGGSTSTMLSSDHDGGGGTWTSGGTATVAGRARPVLIFIPGGGWRQHGRLGPFGLYVSLGRSMAKRGYIVAITSYRLRGITMWNYWPLAAIIILALTTLLVLATGFTYHWALHVVIPAGLAPLVAVLGWHWLGWSLHKERVYHPTEVEDSAMAVAHIRSHIHEWGGDPNCLYLSGQSAGSHITAMLALQPSFLRNAGIPNGASWVEGFQGVILMSPVVSPVKWLDVHVLSDEREAARRRHPLACLQNSVMSFLYPAFQAQLNDPDPAAFNRCFPLRQAFEAGTSGLRAMRLPPMLLMTTEWEFEIDTGVHDLELLLHNADVRLRCLHLLRANHGSYMFDMDIPNTAGEQIVPSLLVDFMENSRMWLHQQGYRPGGAVATLAHGDALAPIQAPGKEGVLGHGVEGASPVVGREMHGLLVPSNRAGPPSGAGAMVDDHIMVPVGLAKAAAIGATHSDAGLHGTVVAIT